jgi:hypothetical protein
MKWTPKKKKHTHTQSFKPGLPNTVRHNAPIAGGKKKYINIATAEFVARRALMNTQLGGRASLLP